MPSSFLNIVQILVSVLLVVIILVQVRGQGSGLFGSAEASFRTRRGLELALFRFTIFLIVTFILVSIISVRRSNGLLF
jgi:protein translocase SecG subunit